MTDTKLTVALNDAYPDLFEDIDYKTARGIAREAFRIAAGDYPTRGEVIRCIHAAYEPWANPLLKRAIWTDGYGCMSEETIALAEALLESAVDGAHKKGA